MTFKKKESEEGLVRMYLCIGSEISYTGSNNVRNKLQSVGMSVNKTIGK